MVFENILMGGLWAYLMTFARVGAALMIMPGLGDSFTPIQFRLLFALAFTFIVSPLVAPLLPAIPPSSAALVLLMSKEVIIGLFFGTVARIMIATLDTAGMIISTQSSLSNAMIFNPQFASQGSLMGAMLSMLGLVLLFALNLHHMLLAGIVQSYTAFPAKEWVFPAEDFYKALLMFLSQSFAIAVQLTLPFFLIILMLYVGMGILARLMPQLQIFIFAIPIQVLLSLFVLLSTLHLIMTGWGQFFGDGLNTIFTGISDGR